MAFTVAVVFCRRPFLVGKRGFDPAVPKVSIAALITTLQRASGRAGVCFWTLARL